MQQYLPFTVLKLDNIFGEAYTDLSIVATVLTVYGIETGSVTKSSCMTIKLQQYLPFTVLKPLLLVQQLSLILKLQQYLPFTVLKHCLSFFKYTTINVLQQYLPFTVLKLISRIGVDPVFVQELQQYLPFTVLKPGLNIL